MMVWLASQDAMAISVWFLNIRTQKENKMAQILQFSILPDVIYVIEDEGKTFLLIAYIVT